MDNLSKSIILWRGNTIDKSKISGYPPAKCMNLAAKPKNASANLTWEDPDDISIDGGTSTVRWAKTVIVRKTGSYPTNESDGTVVVTSTTKNRYKSTPYTDTGLTNGTTYYYAAFACSSDGSYNEEVVTATAIPVAYKTMTVQFNITQTAGYGTYLDDASDMPYGKTSEAISAWQEFFGYKPCLFKNGQVVGYLNPNNYSKFEDGTTADITSGNAGDVMVEFPRRGIKINKSGTTVTVSMTKDPDNSDFTYYAHTKGTTKKDYFYVGAYLGSTPTLSNGNTVLRSLSGTLTYTGWSLNDYRTNAGNLGTGYMEVGFYQFLFIQCMYLLQYKGHLNSQKVHGYGYSDQSSADSTGRTDTYGMMYGTTGGSTITDHVKLFGIEDFWGNMPWYVDGYKTDGNMHVLTSPTNEFNSTGYIDNGKYNDIQGWIGDMACTCELGFMPISCPDFNYSDSYCCDNCSITIYSVLRAGSGYNYRDNGGIFAFYNYDDAGTKYSNVCGRLGYL